MPALASFEAAVHAITDTLIRQEMPSVERVENAPYVAAYVLATHASMPDYLRLPFRLLTVAFDAWSYLATGKPFHLLDPARRADQLRRWQDSRLPMRRALIDFYQTFTIFGLYSKLYGHDLNRNENLERR